MTERTFKLTERNTSVKTECIAGLTTFLTMAYILFVNPSILSDGTGMDQQAVVAATCLVSALACLLVGLFMMKEVRQIDFGNVEEAFPAYIIMVMIALSYSIGTGLAFGFVSFVVIKLVLGKITQVKPAMWTIALLSLLFLGLDKIIPWVNTLVSQKLTAP